MPFVLSERVLPQMGFAVTKWFEGARLELGPGVGRAAALPRAEAPGQRGGHPSHPAPPLGAALQPRPCGWAWPRLPPPETETTTAMPAPGPEPGWQPTVWAHRGLTPALVQCWRQAGHVSSPRSGLVTRASPARLAVGLGPAWGKPPTQGSHSDWSRSQMPAACLLQSIFTREFASRGW